MIRIAICDDVTREAMKMKEWIISFSEKYNREIFVDIYESGEELLLHYGGQYDILILDIVLDGTNGVYLAKHIRKYDQMVLIIFSTKSPDYAFDSFQADPCGYFLKSQSFEIFSDILKKALNKLQKRRCPVLIHSQGVKQCVELGSIVYIEYFEHKLEIHFMDGSMQTMKGTIKSFKMQDRNGLLLHIHKNCLVNKMWVEQCGKRRIYMKGIDMPFEVSRPKWKEVEQEYLSYCKERLL